MSSYAFAATTPVSAMPAPTSMLPMSTTRVIPTPMMMISATCALEKLPAVRNASLSLSSWAYQRFVRGKSRGRRC
jgi:hypothetical protein